MFSMFRDDISANLSSYEVAGLLPFTEYVFRIASKNHIGVGVYSAALGVRTLETGTYYHHQVVLKYCFKYYYFMKTTKGWSYWR